MVHLEFSKRGRENFSKKEYFAAEILAFFTENRGFHAPSDKNYQTSLTFANILSNKSI